MIFQLRQMQQLALDSYTERCHHFLLETVVISDDLTHLLYKSLHTALDLSKAQLSDEVKAICYYIPLKCVT